MAVAAPKPGHAVAAAVVVLLAAGCVPAPPVPPPEEIRKGLSYVVLQPETTCEELRQDFGLADLPIVENPGEAGIKYEEFQVPAPDGASLRVWYMPVAAPRGTVIVSPGNSGPMACYLFTALLLTRDAYSVVMYDYEGFGGSTGEADLFTLHSDLEAVIEWTLTRTGTPQVSLFGISLGTAPTVAAAIDRPDVVNAVVLDSPFALDQEIERFGFLVRGRTQEIIAVLEPWLVTGNIIDQMQQPALVFVHSADEVTPPATVELMLSRITAPVELVRFEGLGHAEGQFERTDEYNAHLKEFLGQVWP